jgi:hypothetical protein
MIKFFQEFERGSNTFEHDLLASRFSEPIVVANPEGKVQVVRREDLVAGIAKREAFFKSCGLRLVKITPIEEIRLDDRYTLVIARTQMRFEKSEGQIVDLEDTSSYIMFTRDESTQIVFYTTHEDLGKVMRERGVASEL